MYIVKLSTGAMLSWCAVHRMGNSWAQMWPWMAASVTTRWWSSGSRGEIGMWVVESGLDFRRMDFSSVRDLLGSTPWKVSWVGGRLIFKGKIERAQEQTIVFHGKDWVLHQKASMVKWGVSWWTTAQKRSIPGANTRADSKGVVWNHCLGMYMQNQESQSPGADLKDTKNSTSTLVAKVHVGLLEETS